VKPIPPTPREMREGAWAIVRDAKGLEATGHGAAVRWARAYLNLEGDTYRRESKTTTEDVGFNGGLHDRPDLWAVPKTPRKFPKRPELGPIR
jgi:hypothetical protein